MVVEIGASTDLLQSHVEWREKSRSISVYTLAVWHVCSMNIKGLYVIFYYYHFDIKSLHTVLYILFLQSFYIRRPSSLYEMY